MIRYVALLRAINVGGKNKIPMSELKEAFEKLCFKDVTTYLNSGNVCFSSDIEDITILIHQIEKMVKDRFGLEIPVFITTISRLKDILDMAPDWWGTENKEIYDNLIFIIPPASSLSVYNEIGDAKEGIEKIKGFDEVIFWSFVRKDYQKTNWWSKTANGNIGNKLTIRTANTIRKIVSK